MIKNVLLKVGLGIAMFYIMLYMSSIEMTIDAPVFGMFAFVCAVYIGLFIKANSRLIERYPS